MSPDMAREFCSHKESSHDVSNMVMSADFPPTLLILWNKCQHVVDISN